MTTTKMTSYRSTFNQNVSTSNSSSRSFGKPPANSFYVFQPRPALPASYQNAEFDGKRLRKAVARKTVDYNSSMVQMLQKRLWQRNCRDSGIQIQPDAGYYTQMLPPMSMLDNPANCITTKFVRTSTNKMRCPIFCVLWTPEGRRLVTGASSGEFTLWNGLTFNFETILQAHDSAVKVMVWSRNDSWMVTADQTGYVKYWQSNMNNVKMFQAHKEPVRAISFCPTDNKFATCSDDGTVRIWDFLRCHEERILRGHGADVKGVDWHPTKSLIASGSKDSQQPVKLWDPKSGQSLATLHAHKNTVTDIRWNQQNGNWLLTSSRDHLIKIFDIRNMSSDMQTFRGHKKEVSCLAWHPIHEGFFASGGSDGSILFWNVGTEKEIGAMEQAHDSIVWSLSWHPLGHILTSGSNDHSCKFWTRNRPGDKMRDKYNLNLVPKESEEIEFEEEISSTVTIPGIGAGFGERTGNEDEELSIPGLGFDRPEDEHTNSDASNHRNYAHLSKERKVPFSKPIPKQFQQQWNSDSKPPPRRGEPYFSQSGFENSHSPNQYGNFQQSGQSQPYNNASNEHFNNQTNQFLPPAQPFFNGSDPPSLFGSSSTQPPPQQPPNPVYSDFNQNMPPPNYSNSESNSAYPNSNYFGNSTTGEPYPPPQSQFPNQQQAPFSGNNHHFGGNPPPQHFPPPQQPSQPNFMEPGFHNEGHDRQSYEQQNFPVSKRVRS